MTKQTEALKLALEALKQSRDRIVEQGGSGWKLHAQQCVNAITAIREALAEQPTVKDCLTVEQPAQQQEPVAVNHSIEIECQKCGATERGTLSFATPPQSKTWVGLTDEEFTAIVDRAGRGMYERNPRNVAVAAVHAAEAKLREKNA